MKNGTTAVIATLLLSLAAMDRARGGDTPVPEPAKPADSLADSIGVCTHWGYKNTDYFKEWDKMQELIGALGVRTIRDGLGPRLDDLWKSYGIKAILVTGPVQPWEKWIEGWKASKYLIAGIEGPNEVNGGGGGSWAHAPFGYQGTWQDGAHRYQEDLYKTVKNDPDLKDIPVIALSTAYKNAGPGLAPLAGSLDYANAHSYAGGGIPSLSLDFRDSYLLLGPGATLPPIVATECGYHTCVDNEKVKVGSQAGVSHMAQRKYIPRQAAEYFNAGFRWAIIYEFGSGHSKPEDQDPEAAFGLLMPDTTPKPAYFALKDMIAAMSESKWDTTAQQWNGPAQFPPRALSFALKGAPPSVHHTVLQRSDGSFQLLLWNEVSSFDLRRKTDIVNPDVPVRLVLNSEAQSITVSRLGPNAPAPQPFQSVKELDVRVPDEVIVVGIKFAAPLNPAPVDPPTGIEAKTLPTSVDLLWPFAPGVDAYWVTLNHRDMGMAQKGPDGKAHFSATKLIPAMTYPFEIVAARLDGGVSPPTKFSAATVNAFPDLVVKSLKTIPENPKPGEAVNFVAMVANIGNAPTDDGVLIGTKFIVDGKTVSWNDRLRGPLAAGGEAEVKPTSGPFGPKPWTMPPGAHTITAFVDDTNRIIESNESNNTLTIKVGEAQPSAASPSP